MIESSNRSRLYEEISRFVGNNRAQSSFSGGPSSPICNQPVLGLKVFNASLCTDEATRMHMRGTANSGAEEFLECGGFVFGGMIAQVVWVVDSEGFLLLMLKSSVIC